VTYCVIVTLKRILVSLKHLAFLVMTRRVHGRYCCSVR